jgi:hypothetical protein
MHFNNILPSTPSFPNSLPLGHHETKLLCEFICVLYDPPMPSSLMFVCGYIRKLSLTHTVHIGSSDRSTGELRKGQWNDSRYCANTCQKKKNTAKILSQNNWSPSRDLKPGAPAVLCAPMFSLDNLRPSKCTAVL